METDGRNILDLILGVFTKVIEFFIMISVGATGIILIANVIARYVLQKSIVGADEIALLLLVWITFLGACLQIRKRDMVAVTFLLDKLPPRLYRAMQILIQICILFFSIWFLYVGFEWLMSSSSTKSAALRLPLWIPNAIFPISMFVIIVFTLDNIRYFITHGKE